MAASAVIALVGIAGCGAAGSGSAIGASAAAAANATLGFNGPFGLGGPFGGSGAAPAENGSAAGAFGTLLGGTSASSATGSAGLANAGGGMGWSTGKVDGSTALDGVAGMRWLFALGAGVNASAPPAVRPGTDSPADAAAGFYDAFYGQRFPAACDYVAPARQAGCPVLLRESSGSADALRGAAIGFAVVKGSEALVTMTGLLCRAASGCVGQHNPHWVFGYSYTFDRLWGLAAGEGGNPLTVTPLTRVAGRWYVDLPPSASAG